MKTYTYTDRETLIEGVYLDNMNISPQDIEINLKSGQGFLEDLKERYKNSIPIGVPVPIVT